MPRRCRSMQMTGNSGIWLFIVVFDFDSLPDDESTLQIRKHKGCNPLSTIKSSAHTRISCYLFWLVIICKQYKDKRFLVKCVLMFKVSCNCFCILKFFHIWKTGKERKSKKGRKNTGKQSDSLVFRTNIIDLVVVWRYQKCFFPFPSCPLSTSY